jgi:GDP-L-fucose synthase
VTDASEVAIWGTGTPKRNFLFVDDMAEASVFVMALPLIAYRNNTEAMQSHINVGFGSDMTIYEVAHAVGRANGYTWKITFDATKPGGAPRKWMDSTRLNSLGWQPMAVLVNGLKKSHSVFVGKNGQVTWRWRAGVTLRS